MKSLIIILVLPLLLGIALAQDLGGGAGINDLRNNNSNGGSSVGCSINLMYDFTNSCNLITLAP